MADNNTTTAEVEEAAEVETPDLASMQSEWLNGQIETMLGTADHAEDEQGAEASDETADVAEEPDEAGDVKNRAPGIDTALKYLDENNPDLADVVRAQIRDNQALRGRVKSIEDNLEDAVNAAVQNALSQQGDADDGEDDGEYTPEQIEQAKQVLRSMGVVTREDLEQEKKQESLSDYLNGAVEEGIKSFGDAFGRVEDGKAVLSEGALERIRAENERIARHGTITAKDLFVLSHFDELVKAAEERGRKDAGTVKAERQRKLNGARTATGTAPETPLPNLRGKSKKDDSVRDVVMRSMVEARKKLGL